MTFAEYNDSVLRVSSNPERVSKMEWRAYYALGLAGEAGEVANEYKKCLRDESGVLPVGTRRTAILLEMGDTLWYLNALAMNLGSSLSEVAAMNIDKLRARMEAAYASKEGK